MSELAKYAGLICAGVSILMQPAVFVLKVGVSAKKEMAYVCRESAVAAMAFLVFSWIFSAASGTLLDVAPLIWKISFIYVILFACWCLSTVRKEQAQEEKSVFAGLRGYCLGYSIAGYVLGFFLR